MNPPRCLIWVALRPDSRSKVERGEGETPWVYMFDHLRLCIAAFLLAGLSISPASSNVLSDLFSAGATEAPAPASKEATAPAPAQEGCLTQPGKPTADGQRWVYHSDGRRKCWFQTAAGTSRKLTHHYVLKRRVASRERTEALPKADADARAEVLRPAPAEMSQPTPSAPELPKVADAAPVSAIENVAPLPRPPTAEPATDQLASDRPTPRVVAVQTVRVSPSSSDTVDDSSVLPATPVALRVAEAGGDGWDWTATWLGVLLMALGLAALLGASLPALVRLLSPSAQRVDGHFARE